MKGIESLTPPAIYKKTVLLFLPEGEYHELGILFMSYILKSRGVKVYYLGANVPVKDVEFVAKMKSPDFIYSHLTSVANNFNFEKFLINAHNRMPDRKVVISGLLTQQYTKKIPPNIQFKKSLAEVMEYVAAI